MSLEAFLGITAWIAPLLGLIFLSAKVKRTWQTVLLRIVYLPYLALMAFAFFWFWGGDGATNLWLVPAVWTLLTFLCFKFVAPRWRNFRSGLDSTLFFLVLSAYLTVWIVVFLYALTGQQLIIT